MSEGEEYPKHKPGDVIQPSIGSEEGVINAKSEDQWSDSPWADEAVDSAEMQADDPWATGPWTEAPADSNLDRYHPPRTKDVIDEDERLRQKYKEQQERKERITEARLEVTIDGEAIKNVLRDKPELLPVPKGYIGDEERTETEHKARTEDIQATLDAIGSLPERLRFETGITLIVGENGLGKSTLARVLQADANVQQLITKEEWSAEHAHDYVFDSPRGNHVEDSPSLLVKEIAPHVHVTDFESFNSPRYYDISLLMGAHIALGFEIERNRSVRGYDDSYEEPSTLNEGKSHRQYVDWSLNDFKRQKERAAEARKKGRSPDAGPQLYFFDEPETGMSPKRHQRLIEDMMDATMENSIVIIPTNSVLLYGSDLPRIDLEHPEWGIFKPSDHPDYFEESAS